MSTPHGPRSTADVAALVAAAAAERRSRQALRDQVGDRAEGPRVLRPLGGGTKVAWHLAMCGLGDAHVPLPLRGVTEPLHHFDGDMVAVVPAGLTLASINRTLAARGQWLPLDPAWADRATAGGIVATNDSGPRRHRYGAPRDLIIGIEVVLADGRVARAGGRVVKNVAGYDLSRLFCGSYGSLGVITSATFKLAPLTAASRTLVVSFDRESDLLAAVQQIALAPVTVSALELQLPERRLLVRIESTRHATEAMSAEVARLVSAHQGRSDAADHEAEAAVWRDHEREPWSRRVVAKVAVMPDMVGRVADALATSHVAWSCRGRAALGVLLVGLDGEATQVAAALGHLRRLANASRGHVTLLRDAREPESRESEAREREAQGHSATGDTRLGIPSGHAVMRALKARFDPHALFPDVPGLPHAYASHAAPMSSARAQR